jgi:hypothetical protein
MALGSTQPVTEISTTDISWRKRWPVRRTDELHVPTAYKFWEAELPGALRACLDLYMGSLCVYLLYRTY